jgi:aromatic ring-cleaving dioxygenase
MFKILKDTFKSVSQIWEDTFKSVFQIWFDTFTLVFRQNVDQMGHQDAWEVAKKAAHLRLQNLKTADLHVQTLKSDVIPPPPTKVKVWFDTFTLVFRQNVDQMGHQNAWEVAKKAAHLRLQNLKTAEVTPPTTKVKVRVEKFAVNAYSFHFDKECSGALIQYLKYNVQGLDAVINDPHGFDVICQNFVHQSSFLNDIKTAIETFFQKENIKVEYVE